MAICHFCNKESRLNAKFCGSCGRPLESSPKVAKELFERGKFYANQDKWNEALGAFSDAIHLAPQNAEYYRWRGYVYKRSGKFQSAIIDYAHSYRIVPKTEWAATADQFKPWYKGIHQHFTNTLLPQINSDGERFIQYWPAKFVWNREIREQWRNGNKYSNYHGTYGTGYLCLTDKAFHVISLAGLTGLFPLYKPSGCFGNLLSSIAARETSNEIPERQDKSWAVSYDTVSRYQIIEDHIQLNSPIMTWEIYEHFNGDLPWMLTGIQMGVLGSLVQIWSSQRSDTETALPTEIVDLLKNLKELKIAGIITEEEFEKKKKKLLTQL